jgi:nitrite reductase/ring-hydroxylating ferredoxin subunit
VGLRFRLAPRAALPEGELAEFLVEGVTWPILAGVIDGEVIATAGVCPHEDVRLAGGYLAEGCLVCPGHAYHFDLRTGACTHDPSLVLRRYRVSEVDGDVWVDLT